ncbi:Ig-like domain-containing protein [Candidatus Falkowbacteria bacterium]|uniref:SbsA Ig-like domain-containing protein n=1 Tax=Candidatus Buchananbacteria bacterium CG10_big_fil_rev_8_21_14_0_10_33_19 TaxID=1974525 RepID=A0A2H0W4Y5_9BACT|nr:Ig-like domain-containing protein [Candidatus Falkowbacteria bacterium]PIS05700.1 MAG: hypothetical protein COT80_02930 [Candidatus Buchananbacteria bacterium CG10_big_fil_rev_8_21_14_0_10_33_19]
MQKSKIAKKMILASFLVVFLVLILPNVGLAQTTADNRFGLADAASIGLGQTDLRVAIVRIIQIILSFVGIIAVIMVLYGGFIWMTSGGDPAKIEKAKKILINTIIGIIVILSSYIITAFIIGALTGAGGGGGGWGPGGGGPDDFGRWGIGVGPIESVYPEPGQIDVPINTALAVTFKEVINPQTICGASACDGLTTKISNVEICQVDNSGICQPEGEEFSAQAFVDSVVKSNDNRTFTIVPNKYLGLEDFINRRFKVTLKSGIETVAEPGKSVFDSLFNSEYAWHFTTNGALDLDPPEVIDITGIYPYPDNEIDTYGVATGPTATEFSVTLIPANIKKEVLASYDSDAIEGAGTTIKGTLTGNYGGAGSGVVTVNVNSATGEIKTTWPAGMGTFSSGQFDPTGAVLNIGPYGLVFNVDGVVSRGNSWTFNVTAHQTGDQLELKDNSNVIKTYTFGTDIPNPVDFDDKLISDTSLFETCGINCIKTKQTGDGSARYNLNYTGASGNFVITKTSGQDEQPNRQQNGLLDAYRNTVIQINFNEAINPATIADNIYVGKVGGGEVTGYTMQISNQYKTVELTGPDQCGTNSCGDEIFCWPVNNDSEPYEVKISAATLMNASDAKCSAWGGVGDGNGRCVKEINNKQVFYPLSPSVDGLVDMSFNSFNGSFDTYQSSNKTLGIAQGKSGAGSGYSGRDKYNLNLGIECTPGACGTAGSRVVSYGVSTPVYNASGFGDDFYWSFFMSSEIDTKAPLIKTDSPTGDEDVSSPETKINFHFDRLMRSSTLKPGWNYGSNSKEKSVRYLVLQTISESALPVGYWTVKTDLDENFDGWADYTRAVLNHNNFDLATKYGPLSGSGIQSITQNCFLPSAGPKEAAQAGQECVYNGDALSGGCASVVPTNPASYGYLNCSEIVNATTCAATTQDCKVLYYNVSDATTDLGGSWIITKDFSSVAGDGSTGCCFGTCVGKP